MTNFTSAGANKNMRTAKQGYDSQLPQANSLTPGTAMSNRKNISRHAHKQHGGNRGAQGRTLHAMNLGKLSSLIELDMLSAALAIEQDTLRRLIEGKNP